MQDSDKTSDYHIVQMILGILVNWLILALFASAPVLAIELAHSLGATIFLSVLIFILYLYLYGILGFWISDLIFSVNRVISKIGDILGIIGFVIRPFPILAYGNNKKSILLLSTTIPMTVLGVLFILSACVFHIFDLQYISQIYIGVLCLVNALFILNIKKCKKCGRIITNIDTSIESTEKIEYYTKQSRKIGKITDKYGNSADVDMYYYKAHDGSHDVNVKTFTCDNCGTIRYGIKFSVTADYSKRIV